MQIWTAPSIRTCFKNSVRQRGDGTNFTLFAAKGEIVSMQILLRNEIYSDYKKDYITKVISNVRVMQTDGGKFDVGLIKVQAQEYISFGDEIAYPDPISNKFFAEVKASTTQPMWVTFKVPESQPKGEYTFDIKFDCGDEDDNTATVILNVKNVTIPPANKGEYKIEQFFWPHSQEMFDDGGYDIKVFSEKWWKFMESYAKSFLECRNNIIRLDPLPLLSGCGSKRISRDEWYFDFSIFDRLVELFIKSGAVKGFAVEDSLKPLMKHEIYALDENGKITEIDIDNQDAEKWAEAYFSALNAHLSSYGDNIEWIVHIQDEPENASTWIWCREQIKKYMPNVRCGDALVNFDVINQLGNVIDICVSNTVPLEDKTEYFADFMKENPDVEMWAYTCCVPEESWYLNRFIDRPIIQSRLLSWAAYSRNMSGFLHYGYSFWLNTEQFYPYGIHKESHYKGDCMILYPSPEDNTYKISSRYINFRDGAQDYELLKIAEKFDKKEAHRISETVAAGYVDFNENEQNFLKARIALLDLAEKAKE